LTSSIIKLTIKKHFFLPDNKKRVVFRTRAIGGFDYGSFEGFQSMLEVVVVLTTIIVDLKNSYFLDANMTHFLVVHERTC
jgi:hypothetical protein